MKIIIIAAIGRERQMGVGGDLPWHISEDLKRFKKLTLGHPLIAGRKTWDSYPIKPLPRRRNIVITRNHDWEAPGAERAASLEEAIVLASTQEEGDVFIGGGGEIYKEALTLATDMYLTHVHQSIEADTFFPEWDPKQWKEVWREDHEGYSWVNYEKLNLNPT